MRRTCGRKESRGKSEPPEGGECVKHLKFSELRSEYGDLLYLLPRTARRRAFHVFSLMGSSLSCRVWCMDFMALT